MKTPSSIHIWSIVVIALAYMGMGLLWEQSLVLATVMLVVTVVVLVLRRNSIDVWVSIIILVTSALIEALSVHFGIWQHMNPDYLGVPLWIPLGWVLFALFIRSLYVLLSIRK